MRKIKKMTTVLGERGRVGEMEPSVQRHSTVVSSFSLHHTAQKKERKKRKFNSGKLQISV